MKWNDEFVEKVRDSTDIVSVIGEHSVLKGSSRNLKGLCPLPHHKEKTPSFSVSQDRQLFHCFGCKEGGDVFRFVQLYYGFNFPEAVEYLARRASISIPEKLQKNFGGWEKDLLLKVNRIALDFYHMRFAKSTHHDPCRLYASKRGISEESMELFSIGYADSHWHSLSRHLEEKGISLLLAEKVGLVKKNSRGEYYDVFRDRLIFPIQSLAGDPIGFGGRTLGDEQPKYLNSPDSPIFHKGRTLYGIYENGRFVREKDYVLIVEGYMDLLSMVSAGIGNVVATLGTALTEDHLKLVKRYTKNVILLFDGDSAGQQAARRALPLLLKAGLYPRQCMLPDNLDPDDYIRVHGVLALKERIKESPELFLSFLRSATQNYSSSRPSDKVRVLDEIMPVLAEMTNTQLRTLYVKAVSEQLSVESQFINSALQSYLRDPNRGLKPSSKSRSIDSKIGRNTTTPHSPGTTLEENMDREDLSSIEELISISNAPRLELRLLQLALGSDRNFRKIKSECPPEWLTHEGIREIFVRTIELSRQRPDKFDKVLALVTSFVDCPALFTQQICLEGETSSGVDVVQEIETTLNRIHEKYLDSKCRFLAQQLKENPSQEQLVQFMNIEKDRRSLLQKMNRQSDHGER